MEDCEIGDGFQDRTGQPSLYRLLAEPAPLGAEPGPETILTATIETIDNDRAITLLLGLGWA